MIANPALGVFFHWLGGLASGSFYVPYRGVKRWAWETYWLVGGVFSWILAPWLVALLLTGDLRGILTGAPAASVFWSFFFGLLWGFGGLTFGLTMRYLGMSLGMGVALGFCAAFGTLMPPLFAGSFASQVLGTRSGRVILAGIGVCLLGIVFAGFAGFRKERELSDHDKRAVIKEFNLRKGLLVATFSGIMSSCFAYGLAAGDPIKELALRRGTSTLWQGLPVLIIVLFGGFTTNFVWCLALNIRNKTGSQYLGRAIEGAPLFRNYLLCAVAGVVWYLQFFFYTMGETQMGSYKFSSWTMHMASIMIFSTLWGLGLHEWKGASRGSMGLLAISLGLLVGSTLIVGYGNYLGR